MVPTNPAPQLDMFGVPHLEAGIAGRKVESLFIGRKVRDVRFAVDPSTLPSASMIARELKRRPSSASSKKDTGTTTFSFLAKGLIAAIAGLVSVVVASLL